MKKYFLKTIVFILSLVTLLSICSCKNKFDRESYVFQYLNEIAKIDTKKQNAFILFIINNNVCSCSGDLNEIVGNNFLQNNKSKYIIVGKKDSISSNLISKLKNITLFVDEKEDLSKYGLNNATHYLFEIKNNKIIYWNTISNATSKEIKEKYNNTKF